MEHDFHFDVFLPESVRRIVVGGYSSDFICFLLLLKKFKQRCFQEFRSSILAKKKIALIITCSVVFIVQLPKCMGVGCVAKTLQRTEDKILNVYSLYKGVVFS